MFQRFVRFVTRSIAGLALSFSFIAGDSLSKDNDSVRWEWPTPEEVPGVWYEAEVPDTLDLAERAELGLNALTGALDPNRNYELYFSVYFNFKPAVMYHERTGLPTNNPKFAESFPMMRVMCGSNNNRDIETHMMEALVRATGEDGLYYALKKGRPWHGADQDFANVYGNIRYALAMMAWYELTGDPAWKDRIDALVHRLSEIAVYKGDYAYYPLSNIGEWFSYGRGTGWLDKAEPKTEAPGHHPTVLYIGPVLRGLALWHERTGNEEAKQLGEKLRRFITQEKYWQPEATAKYVDGPSLGHWSYHFHGWVAALRALLRHAMVYGDVSALDFVRGGYEHARRFGIAKVGWFHEVTTTGTHCESCCIADIVALAIKLSDAGVGDYWDDVDRYVRNQLVEQQYCDPGWLKTVSDEGDPREVESPRGTADRTIERNLGGFAGKAMVDHVPDAWIMHCCTGNGTQALYYAWESIVRNRDGVAEVNLLLNRASPWIDIDSYLPYEGKVILKNKTAKMASIRIPQWVDRSQISIDRSSGADVAPIWSGNRLLLPNLAANEVATLRFPIREREEKATLYDTEYTFRFRGNTVVDLHPRSRPAGAYPLYQRDFLKAGKAPMKIKKRFVSERIVHW